MLVIAGATFLVSLNSCKKETVGISEIASAPTPMMSSYDNTTVEGVLKAAGYDINVKANGDGTTIKPHPGYVDEEHSTQDHIVCLPDGPLCYLEVIGHKGKSAGENVVIFATSNKPLVKKGRAKIVEKTDKYEVIEVVE